MFMQEKTDKAGRTARQVLAGLAVTLGAMLVFLTGNSHEPQLYGPSIASWLVRQWSDSGSQTAHGWLILPIVLFVLWKRRHKIFQAPRKADNRALWIIVPALLLYWAGFRAQQPRLGVLCLISLCWSVPFYLTGPAVARLLTFPCAYLTFMIPLGFLAAFTFPLRMMVSVASVSLLNGVGIATIRVGTAIRSTSPDGFSLDVADPCSGLQSLIAMTILTAVYANLTQRGALRQWTLFLAAIPLAMAGNISRITTLAVVAQFLGQDAAMKVYHDFSGYIVFVTAIILMVGLGNLLDKGTQKRGTESRRHSQ